MFEPLRYIDTMCFWKVHINDVYCMQIYTLYSLEIPFHSIPMLGSSAFHLLIMLCAGRHFSRLACGCGSTTRASCGRRLQRARMHVRARAHVRMHAYIHARMPVQASTHAHVQHIATAQVAYREVDHASPVGSVEQLTTAERWACFCPKHSRDPVDGRARGGTSDPSLIRGGGFGDVSMGTDAPPR